MSLLGRQTIIPRSASAPQTLIRSCCLCCSKHQDSPDMVFNACTKIQNRNVCERCRRMNKPCHPVPVRCFPQLNALMTRRDAVLALPQAQRRDDHPAALALNLAQKAFTSKVEAEVRSIRTPKTVDGLGRSILISISQMQTTLDGILDVLRFAVGFSSCDRVLDSNLSSQNNLAPISRDDSDDWEDPDYDNIVARENASRVSYGAVYPSFLLTPT